MTEEIIRRGKMPAQGVILRALSQGHKITVEFVNEPPSSVRKTYRLSSNNRAVSRKLVERMVREKLIAPSNDGLPEFGESQTYGLAPEATA